MLIDSYFSILSRLTFLCAHISPCQVCLGSVEVSQHMVVCYSAEKYRYCTVNVICDSKISI